MNKRALDQKIKKEADTLNKRRKEAERRSAAWYDPDYEKRFSRISRKYLGHYLQGYFIFDFLACVPVFLYEMFTGFTTDVHVYSSTYKVFVTFKLFKLLMLSRISQSLYLIEDLLKNVFFIRLSIFIQNFMGYLRAAS